MEMTDVATVVPRLLNGYDLLFLFRMSCVI